MKRISNAFKSNKGTLSAPTTNQVQQALRSTRTKTKTSPRGTQKRTTKKGNTQLVKMPKNNFDMAYLKCRLDPFNAPGGGMVPDGSGKRVMVDHRMYVDFKTSANGQIAIMVMPTLPCPVYFKALDTAVPITVAGSSYTQATTGADYTKAWIQGAIYPEFGLVGYGVPVQQLYNASRCRIVTQAYKLYYVDQASGCSGTATVTSLPFAINPPSAHGNYILDQNKNDDTVGFTIGANATQIMEMAVDIAPSFTALANDTVTFRPEVGVVGLLKKQSPTNEWQQLYNNPVAPIHEANLTNSLISTSHVVSMVASVAGTANALGWYAVDPNFEAQVITIKNAVSLNFRIEVVTCVEYQVPSSSSVARFTKNAPPASPQTIALADSIVARTPIAAPIKESDAWWRTALKMIHGGATALSMIPNQYTMGIGGVVAGLTAGFA